MSGYKSCLYQRRLEADRFLVSAPQGVHWWSRWGWVLDDEKLQMDLFFSQKLLLMKTPKNLEISWKYEPSCWETAANCRGNVTHSYTSSSSSFVCTSIKKRTRYCVYDQVGWRVQVSIADVWREARLECMGPDWQVVQKIPWDERYIYRSMNGGFFVGSMYRHTVRPMGKPLWVLASCTHTNSVPFWIDNVARIQVCPKKGITTTFLF